MNVLIRIALIVCFLGCVMVANGVVDPCGGTFNGQSYSLASLTRHAGAPEDWTWNDTGTVIYYMNVCAPLVKRYNCDSLTDVLAGSNEFSCNVFGDLDSAPVYSVITTGNGGLQVQYSGEECPTGANWVSTFVFPCTPGVGLGKPASVTHGNTGCDVTVQWPTAASCPLAPDDVVLKTGLSGGSIFLIILLVTVVLYVALGCVYNRKQRGTTGMQESCPQGAFWWSVPGLAADGCLATMNLISSPCRKGGGSAKKGYDEIE